MTQERDKQRGGQILILALDPGRSKCGLAVVGPGGEALERLVTPLERLAEALVDLHARYGADLVVLGDRTGTRQAAAIVKQTLPTARIRPVDEHRSTEEARRLYFEENPPRGWRRLIPRGLLLPPVPYDDYVAVVLARRFLARRQDQGGTG